MGPEDLLIGHAGSIRLRQGLDGRTRNRRYRRWWSLPRRSRPASPRRAASTYSAGVRRRLQLPEPPNPGRKLALLDLVREAGEFQMGMGIDQAGEDDRVTKVLGRHIRRSWHVSSQGPPPAIRPSGSDQQRAALDRRRLQPESASGRPAGAPAFQRGELGGGPVPPMTPVVPPVAGATLRTRRGSR